MPLLMIMCLGYVFFNSRIVGKYARDIEREVSGDRGESLSAPALSRLSGALYGGERRPLLPLRVFYVVLSGLIVFSPVGIAVLVLQRIDDASTRRLGYAIYGVLGLLCLLAYQAGASHRNFAHIRSSAIERDHRKAAGPADPDWLSWGRFIGFLLLPRPLSVAKEQHALLLAAVGCMVAFPGDWGRLWAMAWTLLLFDLFVYQSRYVLNGIREDPTVAPPLPSNRRNDPMKPFTPLQRVVGLLSVALRLFAFHWLAVRWELLPSATTYGLLIAFGLVFYLYESPRELARVRYRDELAREREPAPETEAAAEETAQEKQTLPVRLRRALAGSLGAGRLMFVAAGAGYALRAAAAALLATQGDPPLQVFVPLVLVAFALGCAMVGAGWARELTGAMSVQEHHVLHRGIVEKPHVYWAGYRVYGLKVDRLEFAVLGKEQTAEKDDRELWQVDADAVRASPWRAATALAVLCAATIAPPGGAPSAWLVAPAALLAMSLLRSPGRFVHVKNLVAPASRTLGIVVVGTVIGCFASGLPVVVPLAGAAVTLWVLFSVMQAEGGTLFGAIISAEDLRTLVKEAADLVGLTVLRILEVLLGSSVIRSLVRALGRS